jgi:hypothetical protein
MKWHSPKYVEIKMDAEIGSYQVDPDLPDRSGRARVETRAKALEPFGRDGTENLSA